MDINQTIILYKSCADLPMHNFNEVRKTGDFSWLVVGYDGYKKVKGLNDKKAKKRWDDIQEDYLQLTKNNTTIQYFELIVDQSDLRVRYEHAKAILTQLEERPSIDPEIKKAYIQELREWRFYLNEGKSFEKEIERLVRQLKAVKMKIKMMGDEIDSAERKRPSMNLVKLKVDVQNIIKRDIDLKKISVEEWVYTLDNLSKNKAA